MSLPSFLPFFLPSILDTPISSTVYLSLFCLFPSPGIDSRTASFKLSSPPSPLVRASFGQRDAEFAHDRSRLSETAINRYDPRHITLPRLISGLNLPTTGRGEERRDIKRFEKIRINRVDLTTRLFERTIPKREIKPFFPFPSFPRHTVVLSKQQAHPRERERERGN